MSTRAALAGASWLAVRRAQVLAPVAAALGLVLATVPWQDTHSAPVLHGAALLTATAVATGTEEPTPDVAAATPYPRRVRFSARLLVAFALAAPAYLVGTGIVSTSADRGPLLALGVEALVLVLVAAAAGAALQGRGARNPAYVGSFGALLLLFALGWLPAGWVMVDPQPWGPPLQAALLRWAAVALAAVAVLVLALRDPAAR